LLERDMAVVAENGRLYYVYFTRKAGIQK